MKKFMRYIILSGLYYKLIVEEKVMGMWFYIDHVVKNRRLPKKATKEQIGQLMKLMQELEEEEKTD